MNLIPFSANDEIVTVSRNVESNCNGITFINLGTSACTVLGVPLQQGQSLTIPCNIGEVDRTNYMVRFDQTDSDTRLNVIRKNYTI